MDLSQLNQLDPLVLLGGLVGFHVILLGIFAAITQDNSQDEPSQASGKPSGKGAYAALPGVDARMGPPVKVLPVGTGPIRALGNAVRVFIKNAGPLLLIACISGGLGAMLAAEVGGMFHDDWLRKNPMNQNSQSALFAAEIPNFLFTMFWNSVVGAFTTPLALYFWVRHEKKETGSFYSAVNYALNRYGRVLKPHTAMTILIAIGAQAAIPGIWFALQYAFVDAIATLDDKETDPRGRSQRLTRNQRGKIFRTYVVFTGWILGAFILHFVLMGQSSVHVFFGGSFDGVISILLNYCFVQYYLDMFRKPATAPAPAAS